MVWASAVGTAVETELGHVGTERTYQELGAQGKGFTDPDMVEEFIGETEVGFSAIAIGTAHGLCTTARSLLPWICWPKSVPRGVPRRVRASAQCLWHHGQSTGCTTADELCLVDQREMSSIQILKGRCEAIHGS